MEDKIITIMSVVFGMDSGSITKDSSMETIGEWDSIRHMNLIVALEDEFDVEFEEEELIDLTSFKAIKESLEQKL